MIDKEIVDIAEEVLNDADQYLLDQFPAVVKDDVEALKKATNIFLKNIEKIYEKIEGFNAFKKAEHKLKQLEDGKLRKTPSKETIRQYEEAVQIYKEYKVSKEQFEIFMSQIDKYQASLNNYLGKKIQTIYLHNEKGQIEIFKLVGDISQAVTQDIASRGGGLTARFNTSKRNDSSVFEKMSFSEKSNIVTETYQEVSERGEESRKWLTKKGMMIFWQPNSVWKKMYVAGGAGDLGEAYLSFMLSDERMNLFNGIDMEWDIDTFMLQGVKFVDNISGLLKGDFSVGDIEYAAKADGASMMGYRQIIKIAKNIQNSSLEQIIEYMKEEYEKILKKERSGSGRRNKMAKIINDEVDEMGMKFVSNRIKNK